MARGTGRGQKRPRRPRSYQEDEEELLAETYQASASTGLNEFDEELYEEKGELRKY